MSTALSTPPPRSPPVPASATPLPTAPEAGDQVIRSMLPLVPNPPATVPVPVPTRRKMNLGMMIWKSTWAMDVCAPAPVRTLDSAWQSSEGAAVTVSSSALAHLEVRGIGPDASDR